MRVVSTVDEMASAQGRVVRPLGLVPTMGALHDGHLSLVQRARGESATVVASIFVNPTQFVPQEDLSTYPRTLEKDMALLERRGVDLVFIPQPEEMYPPGFDTWVEVSRLASRLEGEVRPEHFRGVATVVTKLFSIVRPDRAYFGQKDAQQALVIRRLNADLNLGAQVVVLPTVREPDGLAMSSRNVFLDPRERQAATVLHRSLRLAEGMYTTGERNAATVREVILKLLQSEPLARVDYVSIADTETLEEMDNIQGPVLVSLAIRMGKTRLIDNIVLGAEGL